MRDAKFESKINTKSSDLGRLFVAQGKSRYIDKGKADQVQVISLFRFRRVQPTLTFRFNIAYIEEVLTAEANANDEEIIPSLEVPVSLKSDLDSSILLGTANSKQDLRAYYPSPEVIPCLWAYYVGNVDVLFKILYKPTMEALITSASAELNAVDTATETLLFAVWFATVMTMSPDECWAIHKEDRGFLIRKYRAGLERALAQAGWMATQDLVVLQALTLFLVSLIMLEALPLRILLTPLGFCPREECTC